MKYGPYSVNESDAAEYTLPDPLMSDSGKKITAAADWHNFRRPEIMKLLQKYEYGEVFPRPDEMSFQLLDRRENALGGKAVRKEIRISCSMFSGESISFTVLIYQPSGAAAPVPAFLGLNFIGNQHTTMETDVIPTGFTGSGKLAAEGNGTQHSRWIPEEIVSRGYASVTCCYHDIFPDRFGGEKDSVFKLFSAPDQMEVPGVRYSVIGAWSWGLSRIMDYLEHDPEIDSARVALHGHSRLGKTALWAGAVDQRFKMVISNCSGCGGGALHKRKFGENISQHFQFHYDLGLPCWFVKEMEQFVFNEESLPIDQHELLAMIAPRPLAVGTATEDPLADPKGEFLAAKAASEVYRLYGSKGLETAEMPEPDMLVAGDISFHYRSGVHEQTPQDWGYYLQLADRYL